MKSYLYIVIAISIGIIIGLSLSNKDGLTQTEGSGDKKPLYWVAPMDPNYRRDEPGLSPMGMDLIPV